MSNWSNNINIHIFVWSFVWLIILFLVFDTCLFDYIEFILTISTIIELLFLYYLFNQVFIWWLADLYYLFDHNESILFLSSQLFLLLCSTKKINSCLIIDWSLLFNYKIIKRYHIYIYIFSKKCFKVKPDKYQFSTKRKIFWKGIPILVIEVNNDATQQLTIFSILESLACYSGSAVGQIQTRSAIFSQRYFELVTFERIKNRWFWWSIIHS